ncbi:MAG: LuxR family transcriptional regulator, maltose regulon positive regulatory protein [Chloroflexi bacterium AL-W]|nr:LuxR family transcriptional regulator, maltose regulon positive regulatory protein [Chloroflexi bacterium AL-N1]NOK69043.1 LuxR family transcriptional regulator, maltose regulon positive regulatory protein [Chloroflexi bacterium AL-N10]NOK77026.1 LuxR family transcriptional regulator, maltose regulon positive regulatory protein [Chloroflexi bacterium AL-N5]NOK83671.1 LuxR family transcriptional regulator, maltose regulon positive regulatory protein [Chloroflexi bacterium AL-W]NOK90881.1 LuxR
MSTPILATKLYSPPLRPEIVQRPHLITRLNKGLHHKLTLISAPAGFGKTTLVSEWLTERSQSAAWVSLDAGDNEHIRFLAYLVAAIQTIAPQVGTRVMTLLHSPQPPSIEAVLTTLLNDLTTIQRPFIVILDDYHVIDTPAIDNTLTFLLAHLPPQMHLIIMTREDPALPLARFRARGQLTEVRASDLRFTLDEATTFLNQVMGLQLSTNNIAALETRTEGWIAGLQLAALSMQGQQDVSNFITSFTGSHRFVMDYLVEEVLHQQPEHVQAFLLYTSILDRLCGPLCDAVLHDLTNSGQTTLTYLERANLFIIPLDNERCWYRYHHLFAELLRQRLQQKMTSSAGGEIESITTLHQRASVWYEEHDLELEAFHHAVAAHDVEHAARLVEGTSMPLHFRGGVVPILNWLESSPTSVLDGRPSLWVMYASVLIFVGQLTKVEEKLEAAEAALQYVTSDEKTRDLIGHIASIRATLAVAQDQVETIIEQSHRALAHLHPDNLPVRTATTWTLGVAHQLQGDRAAARQAYTKALEISHEIGHFIINLMATIGLAQIQEAENRLHQATQTYQNSLQLAGDPPQPVACEAHLGLARISYEWNDLEIAQQHGYQSIQLVEQLETIGRFVTCKVFLARLKMKQSDMAGATTLLMQAEHIARQHNFTRQIPEIVAIQVLMLLHQGKLDTATHLAQKYDLPISQARVYLAQQNPSAALAVLAPWHQYVETKNWADERLKVVILQALAHQAQGDQANAVQLLSDALVLAKPGGFIRIFVDEGPPMAQLVSTVAAQGIMTDYTNTLVTAFQAEQPDDTLSVSHTTTPIQKLIEPLSQRELDILRLIAQGLSNHEISERLFLALSTVKGHNRRIYGKLQVQRRTEAISRARELELL